MAGQYAAPAPRQRATISRRPFARLAVGLAVVGLIVAYASLAARAHDRALVGLPGVLPADAAAFVVVGLVVLRSRSARGAGWLLIGTGLLGLAQSDAVLLAVVHYAQGLGPSALGPAAVLGGLLWMPGIAAIPPMLAAFPDGYRGSKRARYGLLFYAAVTVAVTGYFYVYAIGALRQGNVRINPATGDLAAFDNPQGAMAWWYLGWTAMVVLGVIAAVAGLRRRLLASDGEVRQQIRWFLFGVVLVVSGIVLVVVGSSFDFPAGSLADQLPALYFAATLGALPVTVGIGVLKHRLYDLDIVISRSLAYGLLVAAVTAGYLAVAALVGLWAHAGSRSLAAGIIAATLVAAAFQPLRNRAQRLANQLVYGRRATPYEALTAFADQIAGTYDVEVVLSRAARLITEATGANRADVWLHTAGGGLRVVASWPPDAIPAAPIPAVTVTTTADDGQRAISPVAHQGERLGALSITMPPSEPISATDVQLLDRLATHAGLVLHNTQMAEDLRRRLDELTASRQRLVTAQDEARRRLERDLHDGAQQQLIAIAMKIGRLRAQLAASQSEHAAAVDDLGVALELAIDNIRALSRGLYPTLLTDRGLTAALRAHVRDAPLPVVIDSTLVERCPTEVETAAFFCILEALQNAYRHAQATRALVTLRAPARRSLRVDITDDGTGFAAATATGGSGLVNIRDRVEALGGQCRVASSRGRGTQVSLEIPLLSQPRKPR